MTSKKMRGLIVSGQILKASAASRGEPMLPVLLIESKARRESTVMGLAVDKTFWGKLFATVRQDHRPDEAVLTVDAAFQHGLPSGPRPLEDPTAEHCLMLMRATRTLTEIVLVPYALDDAGKLVWRDVMPLKEHDLAGPMLTHLKRMVRA